MPAAKRALRDRLSRCLHISHVNKLFLQMFNSDNFDLLWKFWVSCQPMKAAQNSSFLNKNFKGSDIRKNISSVKLNDHTTLTQSDKTRGLSNIGKYITALVFCFIIPLKSLESQFYKRFLSLFIRWCLPYCSVKKCEMPQIRIVIFYNKNSGINNGESNRNSFFSFRNFFEVLYFSSPKFA